MLVTIPGDLVILTTLYCSECPNLTRIPKKLVNLSCLNCSDCNILTSIPDNNYSFLYNIRCRWLKRDTNNIYLLKTVSKII